MRVCSGDKSSKLGCVGSHGTLLTAQPLIKTDQTEIKRFPERSKVTVRRYGCIPNILKKKITNKMNTNQKAVQQSVKEFLGCQHYIQNKSAWNLWWSRQRLDFKNGYHQWIRPLMIVSKQFFKIFTVDLGHNWYNYQIWLKDTLNSQLLSKNEKTSISYGMGWEFFN